MATAAARNLASRSLHIKIYPTARSLTERREVLRVLERFGEVEMFKSLRYDPTSPVPNAFLSILSTEAAAKAAIDASPIRYRLITDASPQGSDLKATAPLEASPLEPANPPPEPSPAQPTPTPTSTFLFELRISPSTYPHHNSISSSPLYSSYTPVSPRRSVIAADLNTTIPDSISKPGLVDWVTDSARVGGGRGFRSEEGKIEWGRGAGVGWEESKPWRLRDRERKEREREVPWVMRGLRSRGQGQVEGQGEGEP